MAFGFGIPTRGALATPASIEAFARRGEELGFGYLAVADHVVVPRSIDSAYPYSDSGTMPGADTGECYEQLSMLGYLAGITQRARLVASVMVVPHRPAVLAAKTLATLDQLSQGRIIAGVGAGWMREEFEALGAPDFDARGQVTDEYLEVFKTLWTEESPSFDGRYTRFSNLTFLPKPVQRPHPPIWVGGESLPALRRTVRYADVWYPIGANPRYPLNTLERLARRMEKLRAMAEEADRDPAEIAVVYWSNWYQEGKRIVLENGERHLFTGHPDEVAGDIRALRDLGVRDLLFHFTRDSLQSSLDSMQFFVDEVVPLSGETME